MERFSLSACRNVKHGKFPGSVSGIPMVECSREPFLPPQPAQLAAPADGLIDLLPVVTRWSGYNIEGGYAAVLLGLALPAWLPLSPSLSITPVKITFPQVNIISSL